MNEKYAVATTFAGMGSIRRHVAIERSAAEVWELVGDPARLHEWFPITGCRVDLGQTPPKRWISLASGVTFEEDIVTLDHDLRRFQYTIVNNPLMREHLGTVDVIDDGPHRCLVVYSTNAVPDVFALMIGGAAGAGLTRLRDEIFTSKEVAA
jgi:Polyketide cyclase / dehydrase and lipid transport